ncbi:MAG: M14 family metallocarboxypeptidase [Oscillospiraceae bacterium]|nr:M14 family metallocarboxypeptidase [Oscillospiraceae bacterium]MDD4545962.1 M14 family metallocarboxypeptidase [Oscillospiraceae bacterium]
MQRIVTPQQADSGTVKGLINTLRGKYGFLEAMPIGQSVLGRDIQGLILGSGRERILYAAGFHAQEWITSLVLLRLIEDLCIALEKGGNIADIRVPEALVGRSLVFVPQVNPDGVDIAIHGSGSAGKYATMVRELEGNRPGKWQANARGVDINHNFDAGWETLREMELENGISSPSPRQWCGEAPESEPETAALVGLCRRANFRHVIALHSQGEELFWRYGERTPANARVMAEVMAAAARYTVADPEGLASHGGFKDWFIQQTGKPGFTIELGKGENPLPLEDFENIYTKAQEMLLLAALM